MLKAYASECGTLGVTGRDRHGRSNEVVSRVNVKICRSKPEEFERLVDVPTDRSDAGGDVGVVRDSQGSDRQVA